MASIRTPEFTGEIGAGQTALPALEWWRSGSLRVHLIVADGQTLPRTSLGAT